MYFQDIRVSEITANKVFRKSLKNEYFGGSVYSLKNVVKPDVQSESVIYLTCTKILSSDWLSRIHYLNYIYSIR